MRARFTASVIWAWCRAHVPEIRGIGMSAAAEAVGDERLVWWLTQDVPAAIARLRAALPAEEFEQEWNKGRSLGWPFKKQFYAKGNKIQSVG